MLQALIFDFGGTLDAPGRHWLDRFLWHYRRAGVEISRPQLDPAFSHATRQGYRSGEVLAGKGLTELLEFLVHSQIAYLLADGAAPVRRQLSALSEHQRANLIGSVCHSFLAESRAGLGESRRVLAELAGRYRLAVVSNFYGNLDSVLHEAGLGELIQVAIDSTSVGFFKPDLRIYEAALSALRIDPPEAVTVGDSVSKDCEPARQLGMKTVLVREKPTAHEAAADYVISRLDQLLELAL